MPKKRLFLLLVFSLVLIGSCNDPEAKEINLGNCKGRECVDFCEQNLEKCRAFCEQGIEKCPEEVVAMFEAKIEDAANDDKGQPLKKPRSIDEITNEALKAICQQEEWPPDCNIIPIAQGKEMCKRCNIILSPSEQEHTKGYEQEAIPQSKFPSCGDKKELFTVSHIPISRLQNIVPLGNLNPSGHTFPTNHLYFHLKGFGGDESSSSAPVVAPGDIWITRIGSSEHTMKGRQIKDYKLDFTVCAEVRGYFIHLTSLSEKLLQSFAQPDNCQEYDTGGIHYKNCEKDFYYSPMLVAGGESIGTAGGSSDFGLADLRTQELVYANPKRWYEDPLHRVCPLDYFTVNIVSQLKSLLGSSDVKRTKEPICGEVAQDKPGTAQGVWFVKGTTNTYPEDPHLALVHDNIEPFKAVFSVGTFLAANGPGSGNYYFDIKDSGFVNRDFKDVLTDGEVYCYDSLTQRFGSKISKRIILQLTDPTTLRIQGEEASSCGTGPWDFDEAVEFER
ncbi:hypothetical protein HYY70_04250 [Candidatus Woesearchaeota archaeon]|nr:hypothetical protein [Candidatus Woesearchaeota archaeon]